MDNKGLNHNTTLSIGLMITIIAAAVYFGGMNQRVEQLSKMEGKVDQLSVDVVEMKADVKVLINRTLHTETAKNELNKKNAK